MRRSIAGAAFIGIMLSGCGLRYEVVKPPVPKRTMLSLKKLQDFRNKKPLYTELPLPKALQKKNPEDSFITLKRE